ncbi:MAG: desulfoferrodoxin [Firmicutes bacterium]|nr:desulfoferrodoxin [Bacillota bacterium]
MKYLVCEHCGNIVEVVKDAGVPMMCCGQKMTEMVAGSTDAAVEKHVPAVEVEGNVVKVKVGEVEHPMVPEHFIGWVAIKTTKGEQKKYLQAGEKPEAVFVLAEGEELLETYEYCNLHGLWKK